MDQPITRRDFLNGIAIGATAIASAPLLAATPGTGAAQASSAELPAAAQDAAGYYPPLLTGMRGSHPGSFEAAHALRDGKTWPNTTDTGEEYDLIVVGGGISGLAAAHFYRAHAKANSRILILENHDDFGGHAKRNEFHIAGRMLLMNGGTMSIESPFDYSPEAAGLLSELGIDPPALEAKCAKRDFYHSMGLKPAVFFDKETFGADRLAVGNPGGGYSSRGAHPTAAEWERFLAETPLSPDARKDIVRLETADVDYMPGLTSAQKKDRLWRISYKDFLLQFVKVHPQVIAFYQTRTSGEWGVGIDAMPALDMWAFGLPGFQGMHLEPGATEHMTYT
ncbi:MAG: NAD(P)-binding protein, partial [Candidatus Acidiferrales bacterium]